MLSAKEASELLKNMTPPERLAALKNKVWDRTRAALDSKIRETIAAFETKVDIILDAKICRDKDADIRSLLAGMGYENIKITSDFPGYNEDYTGTTHIIFSIPA